MTELENMLNKLNKGYGETIFSKGNFVEESVTKIPFTSPALNYMTYGGLPRGRIIEFAGMESGGKSSTSLDIVANAQKLFKEEYDKEFEKLSNTPSSSMNKALTERFEKLKANGPQKILYIDAENTIDENWAKLLGVDVADVIFYKPQMQCAEEIFEDCINLMSTGELGLVVLDSIGCLVSQQAYQKSVEEKTYGGISAALTIFSKKAIPLCSKYNCTLIGINQIREDMNSSYGGTISPGGKAWGHHCSVKLQFRKGDFIDSAGDRVNNTVEDPWGNKVMISVAKTKCFKPDRKVGYYTLSYSKGIAATQDLFRLALKEGLINQAGAWYTFADCEGKPLLNSEGSLIKIQSKKNVYTELAENDELRNYLINSLEPVILGTAESL